MEIHRLILPDGTVVASGAQEKYAIQSVTLTESVNAGDEPTLGSACASLLEATVFTPEGGLALTAGDEVALYRGQEKLGIFILEKPTRPSANTLKLTGYDRIIKLDKDLTAWLAALEFPMDMQTFATLVCGECGLELVTAHIPNGDMTVQKFTCDGVTGRQLMQWVGEASGSFVRATAEGKVQLADYTRRDITVGPTGENYYFAGGLSYEDYEVEGVDAVQLRLGSGEEGYLWPAEAENGYIITGNPLLQVTEDTAARLKVVQSRIPRGYRPCKLSMPTSVGLRAGDVFTVRDKNGVEFTAGVMTKITQGQTMTIECVGSKRRSSAGAMNSKTAAQAAAEHKLYAQNAAQNAVNSQTQQDVFLKLTDNGRLRGLFMGEDGELYINADYLSTGVIRSADGTVELDLGNNAVTVNARQDGKKTQLVMSAAGFQGYGENSGGQMEHVLDFRLGVDGAPSGIVNNSWQENRGLLIASATGVLTLGTTEASTELFGDFITINSPTGNLSILGKRVSWKPNGDGTYTLIGS